jgi:nicotinamidase-related amidase
MKVEGLIIDPQRDFADPNIGTLFVNGADDDLRRLARMVTRLGDRVDDYHVTLDSHRIVDVAHPIWWKDSAGNHPTPFTIITLADLDAGRWTTTNPGFFRRSRDYVKALEDGGRYPLCVWPEHCLIGSAGHNVVTALLTALQCWERTSYALVDFVTKGSNIFTEHYSAVKADVPDPQDPTTQINKGLIKTLMEADLVFIAGEALSHCVANTVRDIANEFGDDSYVKKLVLLTDASSSVTGFETMGDDFIREMTARGMQTSTTVDFLR